MELKLLLYRKVKTQHINIRCRALLGFSRNRRTRYLRNILQAGSVGSLLLNIVECRCANQLFVVFGQTQSGQLLRQRYNPLRTALIQRLHDNHVIIHICVPPVHEIPNRMVMNRRLDTCNVLQLELTRVLFQLLYFPRVFILTFGKSLLIKMPQRKVAVYV